MEPADHKSLVLALSRARDWLKVLQKRQLEGLRDAQRSLETSLAALLREEERLWAQARGERIRLQRELATVRAANEQAGRAAAATIRALRRRLGSLHTRLLAAPRPAETAQEAAALLAHAACLSLTLIRAHVVSRPRAAAAALGELRLEEEEVLTLGAPTTCKTPAAARDREGRQSESVLPEEEEEEEGSSWPSGEDQQQQQQQQQPARGASAQAVARQIREDHQPPLRAGLAFRDEGRRSAGEGAQSGPEEPGLAEALPAAGEPMAPSLAGAVAGGAAGSPPEAATATSWPGRPPPAGRLELPAAALFGPGTVFHARAVLVQEDDSDSGGERGAAEAAAAAAAARSPRGAAVLGSQGSSPSARLEFSSPRWASAESLSPETPSRAAGQGTGTSPGGGSCLGLGLLQQAQGGSKSLEFLGSSSADSHVPRGTQSPGQAAAAAAAAAAPPQQQQQSALFPGGAPGARQRGWLPAQYTQSPAARSPSAPPPPPCNRLVGQWGKRRGGSERGQLCLPHGLHAAAAAGCLYVVDFGNRRLQELGGAGRRVLPLRGKAYFDVTVGRGGCLALTSSSGRCVELYSAGGVLLQAMHEGFRSPRGIATTPRGEFLVADTHLGALHILGARAAGGGSPLVRRDTVRGFHKPYLVATNACGDVAVSERGLDGGCCVKVLGPTWQVLRVLGGRSSPPVLTNPWGVSLDEAGRVLVADWGRHSHSILCYPPNGHGWAVATQGLSSPRGLALLGEHHIVVADSMHHCLKTFQYC